MKRGILTLLVMAVTLSSGVRAATDTNRFILPYFVRDAAFDPAQPRVFVLPDNTNTLDVIDLDTRTTQRFSIAGAGQALVMSPDGRRLFIASDTSDQSGSVAVFQLNDLTLVRVIGVAVNPHDIVATENGRIIISGTMSGSPSLTVFDETTGVQLGNTFEVGAGVNMAIDRSQSSVLGFDPSRGRYHRFGISSNGLITTYWYRQADIVYPNIQLFPFPDGRRILSGSGLILTNLVSQPNDLEGVDSIGGFGLIETAVFDTNQHRLVTGSGDLIRIFTDNADEFLEERRVAEVRFVGSYEDRIAAIVRHPLGGSLSEIRFVLPRATNATENLPPVALIEKIDSGTVFPVGWSLQVRAEGRDQDGDIEWTRIFSGTELIAHVTNTVVYTHVPIRAGTNRIYSVVRDAFGVLDTSEVLEVFGNQLPQVNLILTQSDYSSIQPAVIRGEAFDQDGVVREVRLIVGNQIYSSDDTAPYEFVYTPNAPGIYNLRLEAEDDLGGINSSPVRAVSFGGGADIFSKNINILTATNLTVTGSNVGATRDKGEPVHAGVAGGRSIWWAWRMPNHLTNSGGLLWIDTFGSDFDTVLAVYAGGPQGTNDITRLKLLAANDDDSNHPPTSSVKFFVSTAEVLYIVVDGRDGITGNIRLRLNFSAASRPRNDNLASATLVTSTPSPVSNFGATKEAGEPMHAGNEGGASVWWRISATAFQPLRITTSLSNFDTLLAVYTPNSPGFFPTIPITNLVLVAANDDASYNQRASEVIIVPQRTGNYWIAVDGYNGAQGTIRLSVSPVTPSEGTFAYNDFFSHAAELSGTSVLTNGFNISATIQEGEPHHAGRTNASASVWFKWIAPTNGLVTISTRGSDFDTVLAVYSGTNWTSLKPVVANDDDPLHPPASAVIFHAAEGIQYHIAIASYGSGRGEYVLALNQTHDFIPRLLTQWQQGRLLLNPSGISENTVLEVSTDLRQWSIMHPVISSQPIEIVPIAPQVFFRLKLLD